MGSVIKLKTLTQWQPDPSGNGPVQLDLFGDESKMRGIITFIDIAQLDRECLLRAFSRNLIKSILDVRQRKSFSRSLECHRFVADYIDAHKISYRDIAIEVSNLTYIRREYLTGILGTAFLRGMTAILYSGVERVDIASLRGFLPAIPDFRAEVNPRSL